MGGTREAEEGMEYYATTGGSDANRRIPRRVVVKVGSRLLANRDGDLQDERMEALVGVIAAHRAVETVLVSSGAVVSGFGALGRRRAPVAAVARRAAAAVGQAILTRRYAELFARHGIGIGQVLLTRDVLIDDRRFVETGRTLDVLLSSGVLPVVNENDPLGAAGHAVGDNDNLAAYTATLVGADLLVILTDVEGVYDPEQGAAARQPIRRAASAAELRRFCWNRPAPESRGGMVTKLEAAERAGRAGAPTVIASGLDSAPLAAIYAGREVGTRIEASVPSRAASGSAASRWPHPSRNGAVAAGAGATARARVVPDDRMLANGTESV